jgi:ABC-type uncharacterized transport system ATPase subunit
MLLSGHYRSLISSYCAFETVQYSIFLFLMIAWEKLDDLNKTRSRCWFLPITMGALLDIRDLACLKDNGISIFSKLDFVVNEGDIIVIQGKSGSGYDNSFINNILFTLHTERQRC